MAHIEPVIEPYGVLNDFWGEAMAFVQASWIFHPAILNQHELTCQYGFGASFEVALVLAGQVFHFSAKPFVT